MDRARRAAVLNSAPAACSHGMPVDSSMSASFSTSEFDSAPARTAATPEICCPPQGAGTARATSYAVLMPRFRMREHAAECSMQRYAGSQRVPINS